MNSIIEFLKEELSTPIVLGHVLAGLAGYGIAKLLLTIIPLLM